MGHLRKLLAERTLDDLKTTPNHFGVELCEDVHFHYRNIRFDWSVREARHVNRYFTQVDRLFGQVIEEFKYKEGDPSFFQKFSTSEILDGEADHYPNRLTIELQTNGEFHIHYRDLRLHLNEDDMWILWGAMRDARRTYLDYLMQPKVGLKSGRQMVPTDLIQPYDEGHRPGAIDEEHQKGIEFYKEKILAGEKTEPLIIRPDGRRVQGFCRYMAYKELGHKEIDCIVDPEGQMGDEATGDGILDLEK